MDTPGTPDIVNFIVSAGVIAAAAWYVAARAIATHRGDQYKVAAFNYWGPIAGTVTIGILTGSNMVALYLAPERVTTNLLDVILYGFVFPLVFLNTGYRFSGNRAAWRQERAIRRGNLVRFTNNNGITMVLSPQAADGYRREQEELAAKRRESARRAWDSAQRRRDLHNKLTVPLIPKD